jgi:nucleoid DNA-binding protein
MTKQELIEKVAGTPGLPNDLTKKTVALLVDAVFAELGDYFVKAKITRRDTPRFTYPGFGTFTKKKRTGRIGRNPQNGEPIEIPAATTVSFSPGQELRAFLNRGGQLKSQG